MSGASDRRRRRRWLLFELTILLVAMAMLRGSVSRADAPAMRAAQTQQEQEVLQLIADGQLVTARRKLHRLLDANSESMIGHYALGRVMHESEGNMPAAMYHLGRARQIYELTWEVHPRPKKAPWPFHRELLFRIQATAQRLEAFEYQLDIIAYHDQLYSPDLDAQRAWPLLRLGRVKQARKAAKLAMRSTDADQRMLGLNVRCAVLGELQERRRYYQACLAALEEARKRDAKEVDEKHQSTLAVHAFNAAVAARAALRPEEAEKHANEGTRKLSFTPANPWRLLVRLYTDEGRMKEAVEALRQMQSWRRKQPPSIRAQARAETDVVFSTVLLLAAQPDTGLRLLDLALDRPDRRGLTSSTPERALGAHALLRRALAMTQAELATERESYGLEGLETDGAWGRADRRVSILADEERVVGVLRDTERLVSTLRVFSRGGIEPVPVWLLGDLVDVLGAGVMAVALDLARHEEDDDDVKSYFDALQAEIAYAQGDEARALMFARRALKSLPKREALLKARVAAVGAQAAESLGDDDLYLSLLADALQRDPSVIRRLGMRLPVELASSESETALLVRERIAASPRIRLRKGGFRIDITGASRDLQVCLSTPQGAKLSCAKASGGKGRATEEAPSDESAEAYAARVAEAFHTQGLAMPLGLSAADLASLDSSTTVSEQAARDKLDSLLQDAVQREEGQRE